MIAPAIYGAIAAARESASISTTWKTYSGVYTGTGASHAITDVGFTPQLVIIKDQASFSNADPIIGWSGMSNSVGSAPAAAQIDSSVAPSTNLISAYGASGFTLAVNNTVNGSGRVYNYVAIAGSGSEAAIGNYSGNGTDDRNITGIGFQPLAVFIRRRDTNSSRVILRTDSMTGDSSTQLGAGAVLASNLIQSILSDGFQVGSDSAVNATGSTYDYIAFRPPASHGAVSSYVGNGTDNTDITGIGFQPEWVLVVGDNTTRPVMRGSANVGDNTSVLQDGTANAGNHIQSLLSDGFQVGVSGRVNGSGITYHYIALR